MPRLSYSFVTKSILCYSTKRLPGVLIAKLLLPHVGDALALP
jgi:hypothetical protein